MEKIPAKGVFGRHVPETRTYMELAEFLSVRDQVLFFSSLSQKSSACAKLRAAWEPKKERLVARARYHRKMTAFFESGKNFRGSQDECWDENATSKSIREEFDLKHPANTCTVNFEQIPILSRTHNIYKFRLNLSGMDALSDFHLRFNNGTIPLLFHMELFIGGGCSIARISRFNHFTGFRGPEAALCRDMVRITFGIGLEMINLNFSFFQEIILVVRINEDIELFANVHRVTESKCVDISSFSKCAIFPVIIVNENHFYIPTSVSGEFQIRLLPNHPVCCIKIHGLSVDCIDEISITFNGVVVLNVMVDDHNRDLLQKEKNVICISKDLSNLSTIQTINFGRIDSAFLLFRLNEKSKPKRISVETFDCNVLSTSGAMCRFLYTI